MDKARLKHLLVGEFSVKRCIRSAVFIYACILAYGWFCADDMIFPVPRSSYADTADIVKLKTADGCSISAFHLVNPKAYFTVLFSHGNGEDLGVLRSYLEQYRARGYSVLAFDYHGYGTSEGKPTEAATYQDVMAAYDYLVTIAGVPPDRLIIHGRSVGGGSATYLASRKPVAGLILESAFVSAFRVITHVPLAPFDKFRNLARLDDVHCPVLVMHGLHDRTVPAWHGRALFARAGEPKLCLWVENAGHDDLDWVAKSRYWEAIRRLGQLAGPRISK